MLSRFLKIGCLAGLAAIATTYVDASPVTALSGTTYDFGTSNNFGAGPETVAPGITWSSTNATSQGGSVYGYTGGYGFNTNGYWDSGLHMIGVNDSFDAWGVTDTMTISFSSPVYGVGAFLNYVPGGSTPTTIAVYDASNNLIESSNLTFLTNGGTDQGEFMGFFEGAPEISSFTLTDNYIGAANLVVNTDGVNLDATVPEPATFWIFAAAGLLGLSFLARNRKVRAS